MRTDLTRICVPCRLRAAEVAERCPECWGPLDGPAEGRAKLGRLPREERSAVGALASLFMLGGCGLGVVTGLESAGNALVQADALYVFPLFPALGSLVGFVLALLLKPLVSWTVPPRARLDVDQRPRGGFGDAVVGRVEADALLEAPLSGRPCVAFRLCGTARGDRVDDAAAVSFTVVTDGGERVRVLAPPARVEIATRATTPEAGAGERLRAFLEERGLDPRDARVDEGRLVPGDRVYISGAPTVVADPAGPSGYRDAAFIRALVDAPAGELRCEPI